MSEELVMIGEGHLREKRPGYWELTIKYQDMFNQKRRKSFSGNDIDELYIRSEEFIEKQAEKNRGIEVESTIVDILKRRYEYDYEKHYINEPGYYRNVNSLKKIEKSFIGKIPIRELTEKDIEAFLRSLVTYSNSVIGKTYSQLKLAYREAMAVDIVQKNLMDNRNLRCPKSVKPDGKIYAMTQEEQKLFVAALEKHIPPNNRNNYRRQLLIELYTGMRMGEINALKPENIDFKKKVIHVSGTISMGINNRVYRRDHTKTNAGMRDVPINDLVRPILEEALADVKPNKEGTIFYDYIKNDVVSTSQVCCFFRRICEKAGIPYYGQHALRHTFATRCIESGIQPVVLKKWMGHTNIHITLDTYSDVFDSMNNNAIDVFEAFVRDNAV
ncbi:MAG: site-specific integrase [Bacteroidales bacterium]|nr:site-specific integrase [Bacteroidales bacterium]